MRCAYKQKTNVREYPRGNNEQSRETGNIGYTRRRKTKQTTGSKDETNIVLCGNRNGRHNREFRM